MQTFSRRLAVLDHRDADVAGAGIAAVGLPARQIASRNDAYAAFLEELHGRGFIAAVIRDIEPDAEAAGRPAITEPITQDLISKIKLDFVETPILFDMGFVAVGGDSHMLQRNRHLRRGNITQFVEA